MRTRRTRSGTTRGSASRSQLRSYAAPIGQKRVHQSLEPRPVAPLEQMAQLVNDHVLQALGRILGKLYVDADPTRLRVAAPPSARHIAICDFSRTHAHNGLPLADKRRHDRFDNRAPRRNLFGGGVFCKASGRIRSRLPSCLDPAAFFAHERRNLTISHPRRSGYGNRSIGFHAEVDVLDALDGQRHRKIVNLKLSNLELCASAPSHGPSAPLRMSRRTFAPIRPSISTQHADTPSLSKTEQGSMPSGRRLPLRPLGM